MPFSTFGVATAVTPSVIETYFSHYLNRKPLKQKPTAHISYHEGLRLIRQFLEYSSKHTVEELQAFTAQWVPVPTWVRTSDVEVPPQFLKRSANLLRKQLGEDGVELVGGETWWQWRKPDSSMHAEWIEMKKDHYEQKREGKPCERVILYIHGGAYYFGSVDEHRYQMQRHARKLKARVLAPRYRLSPQFPFPCGLQDCLATYFYLLEHFEPSRVLFAGDSAGGGMVLSMLVTLRDQGCPLPAGTILLSPWVDLTHSFPSVAGDGAGDYIPSYGFHHKPSPAWPPPPTTDEERKPKPTERKYTQPVEQPFDVVELPAFQDTGLASGASRDNLRDDAQSMADGRDATEKERQNNQIPGMGPRLELTINDELVVIREQFQMYAKNDLLAHPLVSPVQQPSLGGLPPMLIQVGGAELLRDEQIYLAHKAANPGQYPPSEAVMEQYDPNRSMLNRFPGTDVQLQVWEDLCHVPHTLSFTRPAKYMYRSVAQFGAWALAQAQHKSIEVEDDDAVSIISDKEDPNEYGKGSLESFGSIGVDGVTSTQFTLTAIGAVGKAGDDLPPFKEHMIRQRVNRHGVIFPLPHVSDIACLNLDRNTIGAIKLGPVHKWLGKRAEYDVKFASEYKKVQKKKLKEAKDYDKPEDGEHPPATALYNRRIKGHVAGDKKKGKSWGLAMWSGWGSSHDESTIQREEKLHDARGTEHDRPVSRAHSTMTSLDAAASSSTRIGTPLGGEISRTASASRNALEVPANNADDVKQRRRSSASVLAAAWVPKRSGSRTGSTRGSIRDGTLRERESTIRPKSPIANPESPSSRGVGSSSRRSSATSTRINYARPLSSPTMLSSNLNPNTKSAKANGDEAGADAAKAGSRDMHTQVEPLSPSAAPTSQASSKSDTGRSRGVTKVLGSENTFLTADNPRPHNGVVAYPFKLGKRPRDGSNGSPNASTATLNSNPDGSDKEFEMPTGFGVVTPVELPTTAYASRAASPAAVEMPASVHTPETDVFPADTAVPQSTMDATDTISSPARPVSSLPEGIRSSNLRFSEEGPVSPVEPLPTPGSATSNSSFKQSEYRSRDSRLGQLGADGMPTHAWQESDPASENVTRPTMPPFKIRNPVYDPRVATSTTAGPAAQPGQAPNVPFKMRHAIYDAKVASLGSKPPGQQSEQTPLVSELPATKDSDVASDESTPSTGEGLEPSPLPRGSILSFVTASSQRTSNSSVASTEPSSAAYTSSKQASTTITLAHAAISQSSPDTTNGQTTPTSTLTISTTRPTAKRNSSTVLPLPPPHKDPPPQTTQPRHRPSKSSEDTTKKDTNSQLNNSGDAQATSKPPAPKHMSIADTVRQAKQGQFPTRTDSIAASTLAERASRSTPEHIAAVPFPDSRSKKEADPKSAPAQLTARSRCESPGFDHAPPPPKSAKTRSKLVKAAPAPTSAATPSVPSSKFSPTRSGGGGGGGVGGGAAAAEDSTVQAIDISFVPPTIGNLSFEHDPISPLSPGQLVEETEQRPVDSKAKKSEERDMKRSTMTNKF